MTVHLYARIDCYRLGAHSVLVTESSGATALIALPQATSARFFHGDVTHNTGDGRLPTDGGTVALCPYVKSLLNSAGLANTYGVTWNPTTGKITIARTSGSATFSLTFSTLGEAGERARLLYGFDGDQTTATTHTSTQACYFWFAFNGAETEDSGRQPRSEMQRAYVSVSGARQVYAVAPKSIAYGRRWVQRFLSNAEAHDSEDATGSDAWTLERLFESLRAGVRFLWFGYGTTTFAYRNRKGVYALSQDGVDGWEIRRVIPNSDLYWEVSFDVVEVAPADPSAADPTFFEWDDLTFTRSTVATFHTGATTIDDAAVDELRLEDRGDGYGPLALLEGARTNLLAYSQSNWSVTGTMGVTNNTHVAPDGQVIADTLSAVTGSSGTGTGDLAYHEWTAASGTTYTLSEWIKAVSGGATVRTRLYNSATALSAEERTPTATWTRYDQRVTADTNGTSYSGIGSYQDAGEPTVAATVVAGFGDQVEAGRFPSSYIRGTTGSAVARTADTATLATASVPLAMRQGRWQVAVCPVFGSSDLVSGDIFALVSFDNANNSLRIRHNGTDIKVEAYESSNVRASSSAITFSRHQRLVITIDAVAATISVTGATTGNGTGSAGTAWAWPGATGIRVGGNYGGTAEAFCRFELPRAA